MPKPWNIGSADPGKWLRSVKALVEAVEACQAAEGWSEVTCWEECRGCVNHHDCEDELLRLCEDVRGQK